MKARWFRLLARTFPRSSGTTHRDEMLDALAEVAPTGRALVRESVALLWASTVAWRTHLRTRDGMAGAAFFGALMWFALLAGTGPGLRLRLLVQGGGDSLGVSQRGGMVLLAALALLLAMLVIGRSRAAAVAAGVVAVIASGVSTTQGSWGNADAIWYEARWVGIALLIAVIAAGFAPERRWIWAGLPLAFATGLAFLPFSGWQWVRARNYGSMLQFELPDGLSNLVGADAFYWLMLLAAGFALIAPVLLPQLAVLALPAGLHTLLVAPSVGILVVLYLAAVLGIHYVRQNATIKILWRPDQP